MQEYSKSGIYTFSITTKGDKIANRVKYEALFELFLLIMKSGVVNFQLS